MKVAQNVAVPVLIAGGQQDSHWAVSGCPLVERAAIVTGQHDRTSLAGLAGADISSDFVEHSTALCPAQVMHRLLVQCDSPYAEPPRATLSYTQEAWANPTSNNR